MPRQMRQHSNTGIYHVMARGYGGQSLFENKKDHRKFLGRLHQANES